MNVIKESFRLLGISLKATFYFLRGLYAIHRLHTPIISIFGGKRAQAENGFAQLAYQIGRLLAQKNYSVITGGGPGIMKAANCGAASAHEEDPRKNQAWTIGIGVSGVDDEYVNPCAHVVQAGYFFVRKWLLMVYSHGFVFLPGGIGTAEELFELLDLKKHRMIPNYPVILVNREFWLPLIDWYENRGVKEGFIPLSPSEAYTICDTAEEACAIIEKALATKQPKP